MKFKKTIQVIVSMVLSMILLGSSSLTTQANDSTSLSEKIEYLRSIGTTDEAISEYSEQQINDLYERFYGHDVVFSGYQSKVVTITEPSKTRAGNISTSDLRLSVGTYDMLSNGRVTGIDVSLGYEWLNGPIIELIDACTFTWDSDLFYDEGFYAVSGCNTLDGYRVLENINAPAIAENGGMGWYMQITNPYGGTINHIGGAQLLLKPRGNISSSTDLNSKMYFTYAHQQLGVSISFSSSSEVGVEISGGNYSKQTFSYTYH